MKYSIYFAFCFLLFAVNQSVNAQFIDNFDLGTLPENGWTGDLDNFVINADQELQLLDMDPASSNQSVLGQNLTTGDSTSWEFWCRLDFSPSTSNYAEVMLALDVPILSSGNGYVLRIGGISGDQDAIGLYRKTGGQYELLVEGTAGAVGGEEAIARVQVIRNSNFNWALYVDYTGGTNLQLEGEVFDDTYPIGNYFAFSCIYSSSRADKFFFDDVRIGPEYLDEISPKVIASQMDGNGDILLTFSESLESATVSDISNYQFNPNLNFDTPDFFAGQPNQIGITTTSSLSSGQTYDLALSNIEDLFGNKLVDTTLQFEFLEISQAQPFDILITEIMADPSPSVGLPEHEYLEIWNRSDKYFQLSEVMLEDGGGEISLPSYLLSPGEYLALTATDAIELLDFPNTLAVPGFPSLTNDGETLALLLEDGELIHSIAYNISWYQDSDRDEGGYSLELISSNRLCEGRENWRASVADLGGTPGLINANNDDTASSSAPSISNAVATSETNILIYFDQAVNEDYISNTDNYQLDGFTVLVAASGDNGNFAFLVLGQALQPNEVVELQLISPIKNCLDESFNVDLSWPIGLPAPVEVGDVLFNEILFNPRSGGNDYVELYNTSDKILDPEGWFFGSRDEMGNLDMVEAVSSSRYLFPGAYIAFTENTDDVATNYPDPDRPGQIVYSNLPSMGDQEGTLVLYQEDFPDITILDEFSYEDDFHNPLLSDLNGVALERLSLIDPTNEPNNWSSAAGSAGFGTPAAPNSKFRNTFSEGGSDFLVSNYRLSPDDDGFEDFLELAYRDEGGNSFALSLRIYNTAGQLIKVLANNQTVGSNAFFIWDGDMNTGERAPIGLYILWAERFSPNGIVERFKKSIVVAALLD